MSAALQGTAAGSEGGRQEGRDYGDTQSKREGRNSNRYSFEELAEQAKRKLQEEQARAQEGLAAFHPRWQHPGITTTPTVTAGERASSGVGGRVSSTLIPHPSQGIGLSLAKDPAKALAMGVQPTAEVATDAGVSSFEEHGAVDETFDPSSLAGKTAPLLGRESTLNPSLHHAHTEAGTGGGTLKRAQRP